VSHDKSSKVPLREWARSYERGRNGEIMLNELLAKVQAYEDKRQLSMHRGKVERVVYSAKDIVDGQYLAISIHFDRDRDAYIEQLPELHKTWRHMYELKLDEIDSLAYDLYAYHALYKHMCESHLDKSYVLKILSDEELLDAYRGQLQVLRDNAKPSEYRLTLENLLFDITMVLECQS
jgi:hypothetical protein